MPSLPSTQPWFCSSLSREAGEPLVGTASRVDVWFVLEYAGGWGKQAFEDSGLAEPVKLHLDAAARSVPNSRIQLIKRETSLSGQTVHFFMALSREVDPRLYQFVFEQYTDLLALDLAAVATGDPRFDQHLSQESILLVCTHGRRDPCCVKHGLPIYQELARQAGDRVWQCTHLGGHRFAANVVSLPGGAVYGRVQKEDLAILLEGRAILPQAFRGRSCYDAPAQAAKTFLREQTGIAEPGAFQLASSQASGTDAWTIRFRSKLDASVHELSLVQETAGYSTFTGCGDAQPSPVKQFRLVSHKFDAKEAV